MHYSIQAQKKYSQKLLVTGRKRTIKQTLIHVTSGLILCHLGKIEYAIESNQAFWLPFDCLCRWTILPDTHYYSVDVSIRAAHKQPTESGYITPDDWLILLTQKMAQTSPSHHSYIHLSHLLLDVLSALSPKRCLSPLTKNMSSWSPKTTSLPHHLNNALLAREISKMRQSGKNDSMIADSLFSGNIALYKEIDKTYLSQP